MQYLQRHFLTFELIVVMKAHLRVERIVNGHSREQGSAIGWRRDWLLLEDLGRPLAITRAAGVQWRSTSSGPSRTIERAPNNNHPLAVPPKLLARLMSRRRPRRLLSFRPR